ncbi:YjaG family protein [Neiella marina]|uniref:YjaG family protein n=1 Tax=Neiella holothuriorum TaxID=2870530 RepID=A0ABS7EFN9_9GAMM|nr:YjaG family protein [Neiella holothuriorum]MBW8191146.1 YjaG family protein [Neiella holothuriorum]
MSFNDQLRAIEDWQHVAFCAAIAERMLPNWQLFADAQENDAGRKARAILDTVWEHLTVAGSRIDFVKQAEKLQDLIPDPSTDDSLGSYLSLDAAMAIDHCLQLLIQKDVEQVVSISRLSRASVARFIEATVELGDGDRLSDQPLMAFEHDCQQEILAHVAGKAKLDYQHNKALRQLIREQGVSSIGIER